MAMRQLIDARRLDATLEYRNVSDLLKGFREYLEHEAGIPIERLDANAALILYDLCGFLRLGEPQRQKVLGRRQSLLSMRSLTRRLDRQWFTKRLSKSPYAG